MAKKYIFYFFNNPFFKYNYSSGNSHSSNFSNKNLNKYSEEYLGSYLTGLIEGDGYITITNINTVLVGITFNLKDKPLAEMLLKKIGKGYIMRRKSISIKLRF